MENEPLLAVIGGSGLYDFPALKSKKEIKVNTPFGEPSSPIIGGELMGKKVVFLARHGVGHIYSPSEVNYRANIYALKSIGVDRIISVSACGSLREDFAPGDIIIPDQVVDFTHKRARTFFGESAVVHVSAADPFCRTLSGIAYAAVKDTGAVVHQGGTYITIEGPRFSTKAESNLYRQWGISIIGMTACPEIFLAREAEICYTTIAHVTDYDVWHSSEEPVSVEMVIQVLVKNTGTAQQAIRNVVEKLPTNRVHCTCKDALKDALMTSKNLITPEAKKKYDLLLRKYL